MATFQADCPRCGGTRSTFDCYGAAYAFTNYSWQNHYELFCVCRSCHKSSIMLVSQIEIPDRETEKYFRGTNCPILYEGSLNDLLRFERLITIRDVAQSDPPDHLPDQIDDVMREGNVCLATQCWNAAGAMYRLALDLATKDLLPPEGEEGGPNARTRRSLGLRCEWLFENGRLPADLHDLAECLREDGNDGAHDGTLTEAEAEDLRDFSFELLRRMFTEPERLRLATERRDARREARDSQ